MLKPDLILAWQSGNPAAALTQLAELGFAVWTVEIRQPVEIADAIDHIGLATGNESEALVRSQKLRLQINELESLYGGREAISYFYQVAAQPLYTINGEHLISRALELCGGINVFAELTGLAPQIGVEAVLMADPEFLIAPQIEGHTDPLEQWKSWPRLQAVGQDNFAYLPADAISRATPRFVNAVELACSMLDDLRKD